VRKGLFKKRENNSEWQNGASPTGGEEAIYGKRIGTALFLMLIAIGIGVLLTSALDGLLGLVSVSTRFPIYIGPMIVAAIIRNVMDARKKENCNAEIQLLGDISLSVFISIAIMTLQLWELSGLALSMIVLLIAQVILMYLFVRIVSFNLLGRNYDAAVISSGLVGFGMGSTANAMANLDSICGKFGHSRLAYFVVPVVGALFIDFINVIVISLFIAFS